MDVYGLVGNPVSHSLSPPMHEAAYDALDLDARYVTFEPDPDDLGRAIDGAAALGVAGLNVTVPFKRAVLDHVAPDDRATRVGAVNTVDLRADPPTGHNTDVAGARRALEHHDVALDGREAVVVGAGGAGRAVATALAEAGATVRVANRTVERARDLVDDLPSGPDDRETATDDRETATDDRETVADATAHGLPELPELLAPADVLVNATTVGMEDEASPVPADALHAHLAVMDAVYRPRETTLLRDAAARGARTVDGTWMLLFQGAAAFERWTGRTAPVGAMREALRSALGE